ncbi:MAG: polyphenol oxidase family protein [Muribaculaceae bacterium]|nr:polyphenol oxidase family protein [Muribaculaceae bacterium]
MKLPLAGCKTIVTLQGEAEGPYGALNACHYTGDDQMHVMYSRSIVAGVLGCNVDQLVIPRQIHSCNVAVIRRDDHVNVSPEGIDALVTDREDVALCVNTADCVPLILCDPKARVVAAVHSGWRGTVGRIAQAAVVAMTGLGAVAWRIQAAMGPCICKNCFEVGHEVSDRFMAEFAGYNDIVVGGWSKPHVDLSAAIRHTLVEAGVQDCNIAGPVACSYCVGSGFFSARRLGPDSGRTLTAVRLLPSACT